MEILGYDDADGTLHVLLRHWRYSLFISKRRCEFFDVPRDVYEAIMSSPDPTAHFNATLWNKLEHRTHWSSVREYLDDLAADAIAIDPGPLYVDSRLYDNDTPLHVAAIRGDLGGVEVLLQTGADVDARGEEGCTPLYYAATYGYVRCAEALLRAGASPDAWNELNTSPRETGLRSKHPRMVSLFKSLT